ncbi:hypothetical protein QUG73_21690, partial [Klebsiella michiganensis]|nr:hypothetical protein [Klebsiella michiganensis]
HHVATFMVNIMKIITDAEKINFCSGELTKLGHLLSVLNQAVNDNNCENDDIEGCLGIAWDLVKSMQSTIKSNNPEIAK